MPLIKGTSVTIKPALIRWAMERGQKSNSELSRKFPRLSLWLNDEDEITYIQLEALSNELKIPFGYLFLENIPDEASQLPSFRTISGDNKHQFSAVLQDQIRLLAGRQEWLSGYLQDKEADPLPFVSKYERIDKPRPEVLAAEITETLGLDIQEAQRKPNHASCLSYLVSAINDAGITVVSTSAIGTATSRTVEVEECRGFVLVDRFAPFIYLNAKDSKTAQTFTLMHELAHLWLGTNLLVDSADDYLPESLPEEERYCNQVAVAILVPIDAFRQAWEYYGGVVTPVANRFKVSEAVVARRAKECGFWNATELSTFFRNYYARVNDLVKSETAGGGNFYTSRKAALGINFVNQVLQALNEGYIRYTDAYQLTGLTAKTFDGLMAKFVN